MTPPKKAAPKKAARKKAPEVEAPKAGAPGELCDHPCWVAVDTYHLDRNKFPQVLDLYHGGIPLPPYVVSDSRRRFVAGEWTFADGERLGAVNYRHAEAVAIVDGAGNVIAELRYDPDGGAPVVRLCVESGHARIVYRDVG